MEGRRGGDNIISIVTLDQIQSVLSSLMTRRSSYHSTVTITPFTNTTQRLPLMRRLPNPFSRQRVSSAVQVNLDGSLLVTARESLKSYQTLVINPPLSRIVDSLQSILRRFLRAHGHKTENGSRLGMVLVISFLNRMQVLRASHS